MVTHSCFIIYVGMPIRPTFDECKDKILFIGTDVEVDFDNKTITLVESPIKKKYK